MLIKLGENVKDLSEKKNVKVPICKNDQKRQQSTGWLELLFYTL